jgi:transcriptional regulator with XRE-family HTH domain
VNGADVLEYRKRRNLSRRELATVTGLTEGKIWRIENKGVIHDSERDSLRLAGVVEAGDDDVPSNALLRPAAPVVSVSDPIEVIESWVEPAPEVDFVAALKTVEREYDYYFSNSELRTAKRCRRKWWLGWYRGLRPARESPVGVRQIGDRLHRALKSHYSPGGPRSAQVLLDALEREIMLDRTQLVGVLPDTMAQFDREANLERVMVEGYLEWLADTGADSELDVVSSETYLEAELPEFSGDVAIIGKIDVRVRRKLDGVRLFLDHKSVGDLKGPVLMLPLDEQMLHYHLLESMTEDEDERCDGALYNMLRRVKRTAAARPPFFERVEVRHNKHELESYRRRIVGQITDVLEMRRSLESGASPQTVAYPNPTRDCTWDCAFFSICPMVDDGSRVEALIDSREYFVQGDPLDYYMREVIDVE